jgi:hypothetical protein
MAKPTAERVFKEFPALDKCWKDYGFNKQDRTNIVDYKLRTLGHYYVAFLVKRGTNIHEVVDIAGHSGGNAWEIQNDGSEPVTPKQFKKMYIPSQCDWLEGWP